MGIFVTAHVYKCKKDPLSKIYHICLTMIKLGTIIPYLKKTQKIYESRDTPVIFGWCQHLFTGKNPILPYQKRNFVLVYNF